MSAVRFVFPKPRLAQLLKTPGGLPVAEALERAQNNLEEIRPTCLAELQALLELAQARFDAVADGDGPEAVSELYAIAVRGIGGGEVVKIPAIDSALTSLCDLLDHLRTQGRFDHEAIAVHLQAWRLLVAGDQPPEVGRAMVEGLRKVSAKFRA